MSITINMHGSEYTAILRGERVTIKADGLVVGRGTWTGQIETDAQLGSDAQTDEVLEALEAGLHDAIDDVK